MSYRHVVNMSSFPSVELFINYNDPAMKRVAIECSSYKAGSSS